MNQTQDLCEAARHMHQLTILFQVLRSCVTTYSTVPHPLPTQLQNISALISG